MMQETGIAPVWAASVGMWAQFQATADNMLEGDVTSILLQHFETRSQFNAASESIIYWMVMGIGGRDLEVYRAWRTIPRGDKSPEARDLAGQNDKLMKRVRRYHAKLANAIYGELPALARPPKKPKAIKPPVGESTGAAVETVAEPCDDDASEAPVDVVRRGKLKNYFDMEAKETNGGDSESEAEEEDYYDADEPNHPKKITLLVDDVEYESMIILLNERGFVMHKTKPVFIKSEPEY